MQAIYSGPHTYREVSLGDFPNLDKAFYEDKTGNSRRSTSPSWETWRT
jgi:hypothetical protein